MDSAQLYRMLVFATVVEQGSLTAAAEALGVSRSMVSQHLKHLEQRLNLNLLHRTTRKIALSEDGSQFYHYCAELLQLAKQAEINGIPADNQLRGSLKIAAPVAFSERSLLPILGRFNQRYPKIRLNLLLDDRTPNLAEHHIDAAIIFGKQTDVDSAAVNLAQYDEYLVASPEYVSCHGTPLHPDSLRHHQWIMHATSHLPKNCSLTNSDEQQFSVRITPFMTSNTHNGVLSLVTQGIGISILGEYLVRDLLASGSLVRLLPDYQLHSGDILLVHNHYDHIPPRLKVFLSFLQHELFP